MKKKLIIISSLVLSVVIITVFALLPIKVSASDDPNCSTTVGDITLYCYGVPSAVCFTIYGNTPTACRGTEVAIFIPDNPE